MRPVVITVFDSEAGTSTDYSFAASPVRIGRNPLNDLALPFPFVSGWHAVVRFDEQGAKFFDLGSTNGTLLNGRRIQAGEPVVIGDVLSLTIGKLELQFRRGQDQPGAPAPAPATVQPRLHPATQPVQAVKGGTQPAASPGQVGAVARNEPGGAAAAGTIDPGRPAAPQPVAPAPAPSNRPSPGTGAQPAGTAHVEMSDVHQAVARLRGSYDAYRQAWAGFSAELGQTVGAMDPGLRTFALTILAREFPALAGESEFVALAKQSGVEPPAPAGGTVVSSSSGSSSSGVVKMAERLRPGENPPSSPEQQDRFLSCVEDVLRASAKAFVELQKGQEQFGNEMGVRTIKEFTALHAAGTAENVLKYLLDWERGGPHRTQELVGVYADLMIHQVALINGVMEGVRSLLARLAPADIEREVTAPWPTRGAAIWKHYAERYKQLTDNDKRITEAVFGPEFARAYAEVGGEGAGGDGS